MLGSGNYLSFLGDAILDWAEEHTQVTEHEDVIRAFFKYHVRTMRQAAYSMRLTPDYLLVVDCTARCSESRQTGATVAV
jgi:predicted component of viral defense system (DUF524 family)